MCITFKRYFQYPGTLCYLSYSIIKDKQDMEISTWNLNPLKMNEFLD